MAVQGWLLFDGFLECDQWVLCLPVTLTSLSVHWVCARTTRRSAAICIGVRFDQPHRCGRRYA